MVASAVRRMLALLGSIFVSVAVTFQRRNNSVIHQDEALPPPHGRRLGRPLLLRRRRRRLALRLLHLQVQTSQVSMMQAHP